MLSLILALQSTYVVDTVSPIKFVLACIARTSLMQRGTLLLLLVASNTEWRSLHSRRRQNSFPRQWFKALRILLLFSTHYVSNLKISVNKFTFHSLKLAFCYTKLLLYKYKFILSLFAQRNDDLLDKKDKNIYSNLKQQKQPTPQKTQEPPSPEQIHFASSKYMRKPYKNNTLPIQNTGYLEQMSPVGIHSGSYVSANDDDYDE